MNKFAELDQYLGKKQDRPYGNNTRVQRRGENIAIKHFDTDIMLFTPSTITMDCEGWRSFTTKSRLNNNLPSPWRVYQEKNQWYLWNYKNKDTYVFEDGIFISFSTSIEGIIHGGGKIEDVKKRQKLIRRINKFAGNYVQEFVDGNIPVPSNGDCWGCLLKDEKGNTGMGSDHLISHMDEKYYVPSLLVNAVTEFPVSPAATWVISEKWYMGREVEFAYNVFQDQVKKSISKYMKRQLKLA